MKSKIAGSGAVRSVRIGAGVLFVAAGAFKLLAPSPGAGVPGGARAFGAALALLHVPLPMLFGYLVPLVEIGGGVGLMSGRAVRACAAVLAVDMLNAIVLVGGPGVLGRPLRVGTTTIGGEPWRLPLEGTLLLAMLWLACAPTGLARSGAQCYPDL